MMRDNDPGLDWNNSGTPISRRFDDVYFSAENGLAETRAVFLQGCGLPDAWAGRKHFTVAELGFGTGLNVAALLDLWTRTRPSGAHLQVFSVEAFPMSAEEARRALSVWPELAAPAEALVSAWPGPTPGFHRIDLTAFDAVLDVAVLEAAEALAEWSGGADAWFLDGFSPAKNPAMWRDDVLGLVRARSAPGATAATFTVAGDVRRGLGAQGFGVSRRPGHGRKRERLEARLPDTRAPARPPERIAVIGGGIAGAAVVRALLALGARPVLVDAEAPGAGASGNPAALVTPRFDAGGGLAAAFFAQAFERATAIYSGLPQAVIARGALQLESAARDPRRFDRVAAQTLWPEGALPRLDPLTASERLGEPVDRGGLLIRDGLVVEPAAVAAAFLQGVEIIQSQVDGLVRSEGGWRLLDVEGSTLLEADAVCLAAGWGAAALRPELNLAPARGQASWSDGCDATPAAWGGYVIPTRSGVLFGATFDRGRSDTTIVDADHARNLATLAQARPRLAAALAGRTLGGRARARATTPDHLPLCGELEPGFWMLGGLGSRGFTTAPLLGEHLAAEVMGTPSPLPRSLARRLQPLR